MKLKDDIKDIKLKIKGVNKMQIEISCNNCRKYPCVIMGIPDCINYKDWEPNYQILKLQLQSCLDYLKKDICIGCDKECSSFNTCQLLLLINGIKQVLNEENIPKFISQYPNEIGFND
jgi:hypothetical protein